MNPLPSPELIIVGLPVVAARRPVSHRVARTQAMIIEEEEPEARPASDWLAQRLLDQRVVALSGDLDDETVNRTVVQLGLLDATGDAPVSLQLSGVSANLGAALTLVDALDLMGAPVHAICLGTVTGPAVALLAVADQRVVGRHVTVHLCEPRSPYGIPGRELETLAAEHAGQLRRLQERIADACGRPADEVAADMRAGKLLTPEEARDYGLVDSIGPAGRPGSRAAP